MGAYGKALADLMKKKGFSLGQAKIKLNIKSKTTFSRILHDDCSQRALIAFNKKILAEDNPLRLSNSEIETLRTAFLCSMMGDENYRSYSTLMTFIETDSVDITFSGSQAYRVISVSADKGDNTKGESVSTYIEKLTEKYSKIDVTVINCLNTGIIGNVIKLLGTAHKGVIKQYIHTDNFKKIESGLVYCILCCMHKKDLFSYEIMNNSIFSKENMLIIKGVLASGETCIETVFFNDGTKGIVITDQSKSSVDFIMYAIDCIKNDSVALKFKSSTKKSSLISIEGNSVLYSGENCCSIVSDSISDFFNKTISFYCSNST